MRRWLPALAILILTAPPARAQTPGVTIDKQPATFASRMFDPASPPADMPLPYPGEDAECDSEFLSNASVGGRARQTDATHATVTVTRIKITLQLNVTTWLPANVTQHVIEHEDGHRQISDNFYRTADKLAAQIAGRFMGKQVVISGENLGAELGASLQKLGADISEEYKKELNPEQAQLRFDAITDHSRNEVPAKDAVAQALKVKSRASPRPVAHSGN